MLDLFEAARDDFIGKRRWAYVGVAAYATILIFPDVSSFRSVLSLGALTAAWTR